MPALYGMNAHTVFPERPAVFVDLEGTLVETQEFALLAGVAPCLRGAPEALHALAGAGFAVIVVTNQSGLALGRFTRSDFAVREARLQRSLQDVVDVHVGSFMVCPHRPGPDGRPACLCRKPAPGLLLRAARAQHLDLAGSWMIGDSDDDIEAGRRAGCRTVLLKQGSDTSALQTRLRMPHRRCTEWDEVVHEVLKERTQAHALPAT